MLSSTTSRLSAFAAGLALIGGGAAAVGSATDPKPPFQDCLKVAAAAAGSETAMGAGHGGEAMVAPVPGADGLRSELAGVTLNPVPRRFAAGATSTWRFRLTDCDGHALRALEPENGKLLHLIVVRSDLTAYQHLHPRLGRDDVWSVALRTPRPGRYRAIADFVTGGRKYVVGTTLTVPGRAPERPLPAPALHARVDGYDVELQRPATLPAGEESQLTFRITHAGHPVNGLQPYLGSFGHLVALHAPDISYSHVHPNSTDRAQGAITFDTELHERGRYRLFLQFRTGGRVHTAAFSQTVS